MYLLKKEVSYVSIGESIKATHAPWKSVHRHRRAGPPPSHRGPRIRVSFRQERLEALLDGQQWLKLFTCGFPCLVFRRDAIRS